MAGVVALLLMGSVLLSRGRGYVGDAATYLAAERMVAVTSGVSPAFPMLFVGLCAASFIVAQLKRRYLAEQFSIKDLVPRAKFVGDGEAAQPDQLTAVEGKIDELKRLFDKPLRVFRLGDLVPTFLLAVYVTIFLTSGFHLWFVARLGEGFLFTKVFWSCFCAVSVLLAFNVYLVFVTWNHLKQILADVSRLPLARSFERMPARVARWFFEEPRPLTRSLMVQDQATALAARCTQVRPALERLCSRDPASLDYVSPAEWDTLPAKLSRMNERVSHNTEERARGGGDSSSTRGSGAAV